MTAQGRAALQSFDEPGQGKPVGWLQLSNDPLPAAADPAAIPVAGG